MLEYQVFEQWVILKYKLPENCSQIPPESIGNLVVIILAIYFFSDITERSLEITIFKVLKFCFYKSAETMGLK